MSWPAVLLICLSSQASPGIHSCLLRLSGSTLENITHGRDGRDLKCGVGVGVWVVGVPLQNNKVWFQHVTAARPHAAVAPNKMVIQCNGRERRGTFHKGNDANPIPMLADVFARAQTCVLHTDGSAHTFTLHPVKLPCRNIRTKIYCSSRECEVPSIIPAFRPIHPRAGS